MLRAPFQASSEMKLAQTCFWTKLVENAKFRCNQEICSTWLYSEQTFGEDFRHHLLGVQKGCRWNFCARHSTSDFFGGKKTANEATTVIFLNLEEGAQNSGKAKFNGMVLASVCP